MHDSRYQPLLLTLAPLLAPTALAGPLDLDPDHLPAIGEPGPHGGRWVHFQDSPALEALPAIVITQDAALPPPHPSAVPLGPSGRSWRIPVRSVREAVQLGAELRALPGVRSALPDLILPRQRTMFNDPRYSSQWYLDLLEMEPLYETTLGDPSVRVAVIDSAIDLDHPDLAGSWISPLDAYDDDDDPRPVPGVYCPSSTTDICDHHGTSVAGIIGARANNGIDIVGLCPACTLVPIRLIGPGRGTLGADVAAFEHAIAAEAGVINNSWGFSIAMPVPAPLADIIRVASTEARGGRGALVVFAAGNDDREIGPDELGALPEVLNVTATDRYGLPTAYTNRGDSVAVAAPSATVTLQAGEGVTTTFGGTSAAAPVVAGLAGWALSVDPSLHAHELRALLIAAAVPSPQVTHDDNGHHQVYGYGEISASRLHESLVPSSESEPRGCGCTTAPLSPALPSLFLAAACLVRRRRSKP